MAKSIIKEAKILDAVIQEEEGTEDDPSIEQYILLQLQDSKTERIFNISLSKETIKEILLNTKVIKCPHCQNELTQEQVNEIADKSRTVYEFNNKELHDFRIHLLNRESPIFVKCDPDDEEITADMIKNEEGI